MRIARVVLLVLASVAPAAVLASTGFINCDSIGYRYNYCAVRTQGRVTMIHENSSGNLCRQGRGWGYDDNGIWVDKGCRAQFSYGRDDGGGGGNWGRRSGELTCESKGYRYSYCNADTRGRVTLVREISTGNLCTGRNWGYDDGGIWVDRGCRGIFRYGRDGGGRNDDAAIAAGILGAFAIGAAAGSSQPQSAPPPQPPPPPANGTRPAAWAIGSYQAYDPDSGDIVQLVVDGAGKVYLRNETGNVMNQGDLRDGMIYWSNGKRSWFAREGPGVMVGDIDTGKHFYFRRNA